jgi:hypothetical protein
VAYAEHAQRTVRVHIEHRVAAGSEANCLGHTDVERRNERRGDRQFENIVV